MLPGTAAAPIGLKVDAAFWLREETGIRDCREYPLGDGVAGACAAGVCAAGACGSPAKAWPAAERLSATVSAVSLRMTLNP